MNRQRRSLLVALGLLAGIVAVVLVAVGFCGSGDAPRRGRGASVPDESPPEVVRRRVDRDVGADDAGRSEPRGAAADDVAADRVLLAGVVITPDGAFVGDARVLVSSTASATRPILDARTDESGHFALRSADVRSGDSAGAGLYTIRAESMEPRRVSRPRTFDLSVPQRRTCVLVLRSGVVVRGRLVDAAGLPAAGEILVLSYPTAAPEWDADGTTGTRRVLATSDDGLFQVLVPTGHVRLHGRRESGLFGPSRRSKVVEGTATDEVVVTAGGPRHTVDLVVRTETGEPLAGAEVRLAPDDACQRLIAGQGDEWAHYRTGSAGRVSFDVVTSYRPLVLGVTHPQYEIVELLVDRSSALGRSIDVRLRSRPQVELRVVLPDGRPPVATLQFGVRARAVPGAGGAAPRGPRRLVYGVAPGSYVDRDADVGPAGALAIRRGTIDVEPRETPGVFDVLFARGGPYVLDVRIGSATVATVDVEVPDRGPYPVVVHRLSPGRWVTVRAHVPAAGLSRPSAWHAWTTAVGEFQDQWPVTRDEFRTARITGFALLRDAERGARVVQHEVWVPWSASEVVYRDLTQRRLMHGDGPHRPESPDVDGRTAEGRCVGRLLRVPIPPGERAQVDLRLPSDAAGESLVPVRVRVGLGLSVPLADVELRVRATETRLRRVAFTNERGVAELALPPGTYEVEPSVRDAPSGPARLVVPSGADAPVDLVIDLSMRRW